jgi:tetratricopeptide (TPR) repeat protein
MKKALQFFAFAIFMLFGNNSFAQSVEDIIKEADKLVSEFQHEKVLNLLLQADKQYPNNWQIKWRISRAYVDVGEHLPDKTDKEKEEQLEYYKKSFDYADQSVKLAPSESITYVRRAIANGRIALFQGVFSAIGTVKDVKADCERAIQLGNGGNYVQALAHYVLGRTHLKVCEKSYLVRLPLGLGWGDTGKALQLLETANKLYPNFRMFMLELAKAYIEEDQVEKAKDTLKKLEKAPFLDEDDDIVLAEAKKLYDKIKK